MVQSRGEWFVLYGRVVPLMRTFVSLPAGVVEMDVPRFLAFTFVGVTAWVALLSSIGFALGSNWAAMTRAIGYTGYAVAFAGAAALTILALRLRRSRCIDGEWSDRSVLDRGEHT